MMLKVIASIGSRVGKYWIGTEPLAQRHIAALRAREAAVSTLVHENGETKLARTDHHDSKDVGQRVRVQSHKGHRTEDYAPGVDDQRNALPFDRLAQAGELARRHQLTCCDPVRCGGTGCGHDGSELLQEARC